ncbi:MAG TPA: PQQ-dependent sugar dehydrogenase [Pseudomonadales bacterium]|nr:PQQ-dependent sugar dehydrogenase [Pseudomonadales bacterium]
MKWLKRIAIALIAVVVLVVAAAWLWLPPVNVPFKGMLANLAPSVFPVPTADAATVKSRLIVPAGYGIGLFARDIPNARMVRMTAHGDVLVASPGQGRVYWLAQDANGDGESDDRRVLLDALDGPNGLDLLNGYLYVAEQGKVGRVRFDDVAGKVDGKYEIVIDGLPTGGNHWKKTIRFGPDGLLYLNVGSSCNVCMEEDDRRAAMLRYTPDGKFVDIYATGLRNSAGFDWRADGTLYATDNGRDLLGDDFPPCELDQIRQGAFYGWPFANGDRVPDPDLGAGREAVIDASIPPAFSFRAHNAPLGMVFLRSEKQLDEFRGDALVALHGSWNRSRKDGYKVVALHWAADGMISARDFLTGFLTDENVIGRPAEVTEAADGSIYVSDDYANAVYRIVPGGTQTLEIGSRKTRADTANAGVADPRLIARGATVFGQRDCQQCHALGGDGKDGRVVLAGLSARYDSATLAAYLAQPRQPMPAVEDADARTALAAFLLDRPQPHGKTL